MRLLIIAPSCCKLLQLLVQPRKHVFLLLCLESCPARVPIHILVKRNNDQRLRACHVHHDRSIRKSDEGQYETYVS